MYFTPTPQIACFSGRLPLNYLTRAYIGPSADPEKAVLAALLDSWVPGWLGLSGHVRGI